MSGYRYKHRICGSFNHGLVDGDPPASPPEAEVRIVDVANTVRERRTIPAS